ncbi:MAG: hypothetical protein Q4A34_02690 [Candidatus Saccharibacteria bacterium]|nr:hypothetical protein [Candidatus Saccharibacteria bacterium]
MKKGIIAAAVVVAGVCGLVLSAQPAGAAVDLYQDACSTPDAQNTEFCKQKGKSADSVIQAIINFLLMLGAIISVIMIIIGGFKYTTSNGDANQVTAAKNTILYAVVGLVVSLFAWSIVNFAYQFMTKGPVTPQQKAQEKSEQAKENLKEAQEKLEQAKEKARSARENKKTE